MTEEPRYDIELTYVFDGPPEPIFMAFTDPDEFARWYGPVGFPARRDTVELDARVGGLQRFVMVSEADPSMRTGFTGRFTQVVPNQLLASSGSWQGIPARMIAGSRTCEWSSMTRTARPGLCCGKVRTQSRVQALPGGVRRGNRLGTAACDFRPGGGGLS
jgi:uncharacterized protein YndB with AHSA1/START domain